MMRWQAWIAALLGLALAAAALAQTSSSPTVPSPAAKPAPTGGLRGPVATPGYQRTPDPELDPDGTDTAQRLDRSVGGATLGGADCRTDCDKTYYICLAADDQDRCNPAWAQCIAACPSTSGNF